MNFSRCNFYNKCQDINKDIMTYCDISCRNQNKCTCVSGECDCPVAQQLWAEVNRQYEMLRGYPTSFEGWRDYDNALAKYREHKYSVIAAIVRHHLGLK